MSHFRRYRAAVLFAGVLCAAPLFAHAAPVAQNTPAGQNVLAAQNALAAPLRLIARPETRITAKIDNTKRVAMRGSVHYLARPEYDRGPVAGSTVMKRMVLLLSHTGAQDAALNSLLKEQQDRNSALFHKWLTPEEFGAQFGASDADIATITNWLTSQGFTIDSVAHGRNSIEFSGNAAQVTKAFQTPIDKYSINGIAYQANSAELSIPAALAPVVGGVLSLYNFPRRPDHESAGEFRRDAKTGQVSRQSGQLQIPPMASTAGAPALPSPDTGKPDFTFTPSGGTSSVYGIGPYDFAAIYNLLPLWNAGIDGTGQSIAILQETNIHLDDVRSFRSLFGLPANDPVVILNGPDPGVTSYDEGEADIDVEWSGAVARGATIYLIASASTATTNGVDLSAIYAVDNDIAPITSLSYGDCESSLGTTGNAFYNALWQQGAAEGISHFVSTGDSGSSCLDDGNEYAKNGISVSGMASSPYDTAVGGTDLLGTILSPGTFWNATNASTTQASALSYMPESTWDNNCTNPLYETSAIGAAYASAGAACQGYKGYVNDGSLAPVGGSGGESTIYSKPSWQSGTGVPADGKRDIPDVSLMAANGSVIDYNLLSYVGSFYLVCQEDVDADGESCNLNSPYTDFAGYGGTSISTPAFAGIMAMVDQKTNARQGVANYILYDLFNQQTAAGTACTSAYAVSGTTVGAPILPAAGCVFHDITSGANSSACKSGSANCVVPSGDTYGILTTSATAVPSSTEAYLNGVGYDLATGLGSVNATNLVNDWANVTFVFTTTTLALNKTTLAHGTAVNATVTVAPSSGGAGVPSGNIELLTSTTPTSLGFVALTNGSVVGSFSDLPGGSYTVSAHYGGDGTYAPSDSASILVNVTPENSKLTGSIYSVNESTGAETSTTMLTYGGEALISMTAAGVSGNGVPTGNVTITNNAGLASGPFALNSAGEAGYDETTLPAGATYSFSGSYAGDSSFNASSTASAATLTVSQSPSATATTKGTNGTIAAGVALTLTGTVVGSNAAATGNFGAAPTGTLSFYESATSGAITGGTLLETVPITSISTSATTGIGSLTVVPPYSTTGSSTEYFYTLYSGDTNYSASSGALTTKLTVSKATKTVTTSALTASPTTVSYGNSTTFTSTISTATGTPTGTVMFYVDGVASGAAVTLVNKVASASLVLTGGSHAITAIYSGDGAFLGSTGALTFNVTAAATTLTLSDSASSVTQGTPVTFTALLPYTQSIPPTGTITFSVDGAATGVGIAPLSLSSGGFGALFNSSSFAPGAHIVGAAYSGGASYLASSATTALTVSAAPTLLLTVNQRTAIMLGAPVTIDVQAKSLGGGPIPTGSINYSVDGGSAANVALVNAATSFTLSGLNELQHTVTVLYSGDGTYTAVSQTLVLNGDVAQTILFRGLANATFADTHTIALAARSTSGLPVTYSVSGPASLNGSMLTLTGTGTVTVTASQAGNSSFAAATSVTVSFRSQ